MPVELMVNKEFLAERPLQLILVPMLAVRLFRLHQQTQQQMQEQMQQLMQEQQQDLEVATGPEQELKVVMGDPLAMAKLKQTASMEEIISNLVITKNLITLTKVGANSVAKQNPTSLDRGEILADMGRNLTDKVDLTLVQAHQARVQGSLVTSSNNQAAVSRETETANHRATHFQAKDKDSQATINTSMLI